MIIFDKVAVYEGDTAIVDLSFGFSDSIAIVGQSGSGKSLTLKAIIGALPKELRAEVSMSGADTPKRGENISFVPQNPFTALSPMSKIKKQFWGVDLGYAVKLMMEMGLDEATLGKFPSQLSGGQLQRVIIALSLAKNPRILLMDEPTTALDSDTKADIIALVKKLQQQIGFYLIFVTHELRIAKELCNTIMVIRNGRSVETASAGELFEAPREEYTRRLLEADFHAREFRK